MYNGYYPPSGSPVELDNGFFWGFFLGRGGGDKNKESPTDSMPCFDERLSGMSNSVLNTSPTQNCRMSNIMSSMP